MIHRSFASLACRWSCCTIWSHFRPILWIFLSLESSQWTFFFWSQQRMVKLNPLHFFPPFFLSLPPSNCHSCWHKLKQRSMLPRKCSCTLTTRWRCSCLWMYYAQSLFWQSERGSQHVHLSPSNMVVHHLDLLLVVCPENFSGSPSNESSKSTKAACDGTWTCYSDWDINFHTAAQTEFQLEGMIGHWLYWLAWLYLCEYTESASTRLGSSILVGLLFCLKTTKL